ncbi:MAG: hypothetical protein R2939_01900 [Kofleriaceae bacterium]
MTTWDELRRDPVSLRAYLDQVDAQLSASGIAIHARVIHAWTAIQTDTRSVIPLGHPSLQVVDVYFKEKYGRRGLLDMSVGRMLVLFGHEAWALRFPMVYGTVRIDLARMIEDGTPDVLARMSSGERAHLDDLLPRAFRAFYALREVSPDLRADLSTAVEQAINPRGHLGLSKWSSQQAVEKMLKSYVLKQQHPVPKRGHKLEPIVATAEHLGLPPLNRNLLASVECDASARYPMDGVQVTLREAVEANQAATLLCGEIASTLEPSLMTIEVVRKP